MVNYFLAQDDDVVRRLDPYAHLIAVHTKDGEANIVVDNQCFVCSTA
jgi:hypothetical protein